MRVENRSTLRCNPLCLEVVLFPSFLFHRIISDVANCKIKTQNEWGSQAISLSSITIYDLKSNSLGNVELSSTIVQCC